MKKTQDKAKYIAPGCEILRMQIENAIMASSTQPSGSLGELEDNNIFSETFI